MTTFISITETTEFSDALKKFNNEIPRFVKLSGFRKPVSVRLPNPLVKLILARGAYAYESVQKKLTASLEQFCEIGYWSQGKTETGEDYIEFKLIPERVQDEV